MKRDTLFLKVAILIVLEQGWKHTAKTIFSFLLRKVAILIVLEQGWKVFQILETGRMAVAILIVLEQGWKL